jgi:ribonuclease HII
MARQSHSTFSLPAAPTLEYEMVLWASGIRLAAGIDEAGRGALAGPVAAAAVILPPEPALGEALTGVRDSKQMTPAQRALWAGRIQAAALAWGVGMASHLEIDDLGIVAATYLAAHRALAALSQPPQHLLVDYFTLPDCELPQTGLVKGDARCLSIAAASVLAKTARDEWMCCLDREYPAYGFSAHKGYGTAAHRQALARLGPCPFHRTSFTLIS